MGQINLRFIGKTSAKPYGLLLLCIIGFVVLLNFVVMDFVQDDGYITFHYAQNISDHGTLYYNVNEHGPIGYSNFSYVALLVILRLFSFRRLSFELLARGVATFSLATLLFYCLLAIKQNSLYKNKWLFISQIALCLYFFVSFPFLLPNYFSGLETALFTLLIFLLIFYLFVGKLNNKLFTLYLIVAITLRIDAIIVLLPIVIIYGLNTEVSLIQKVQSLTLAFGLWALGFLCTYLLTGAWLPLSFGHKSQGFSLETLLSYIKFVAITLSPLAILLVAKQFRLVLFVGFQLLFACFFYSFFIHWHFERYIFPFVFAAFAIFVLVLYRDFTQPDIVKLVFVAIYILFTFFPGTLEGFSWVSGYRISMINLKLISDAFKDAQLDEKYRSFASYDAGYITYQTNWEIVDLAGLTTPQVIRQDVGKVIAESNPTVLIISTSHFEDPAKVMLSSQYRQASSPIPANYRFIKYIPLTNLFWWPTSHYSYYIYTNENAPTRLIDRIRGISVDPKHAIGYQQYIFYLLNGLAQLSF